MATYPPAINRFLTRFQLQPPAVVEYTRHTRQAAVLVPIATAVRPQLLLTVRSAHLRRHQGQVAFPGGLHETGDTSLIATALRETSEEIDITPASVNIIGTLPALDSTSGFRVTPVIGLIPPHTPWRANLSEVAEIFLMPLENALNLQNHQFLDIHHQGRNQRVWLYWHQHHLIWGITAKILHHLARQISGW